MNESMRGTRLGSSSYEVDKGIRVPVRLTTYMCSHNHQMTFPFYADAEEVPDTWTCECGDVAVRLGATIPIQEPPRRPRTHYEILRERRSEAELRALLAERLDVMRHGSSQRTA
jgi:RNA polymerase-binding protein